MVDDSSQVTYLHEIVSLLNDADGSPCTHNEHGAMCDVHNWKMSKDDYHRMRFSRDLADNTEWMGIINNNLSHGLFVYLFLLNIGSVSTFLILMNNFVSDDDSKVITKLQLSKLQSLYNTFTTTYSLSVQDQEINSTINTLIYICLTSLSKCQECMTNILSNVNKTVKNSDITTWYYFIDLGSMSGYAPVSSDDMNIDSKDIQEWLFTTSQIDLKVNDEDLQHKYSSWLQNTVSQGKRELQSLSFVDWLENPFNWGKSGSSYLYSNIIIDNKKTSKTKWNTSMSYSMSQLEQKMSDDEFMRSTKLSYKRETKGVRAIVTSNDGLYLYMAYVSRFVEPMMVDNMMFSQFMTQQGSKSMADTIMHGTEQYCMPFDAKHFDWQVSKRQLKMTNMALETLVERTYPGNTSLIMIMKKITYYVDNLFVDGRLVTNGLLSGLRWTALYGTLINYFNYRYICEVSSVYSIIHFHQGDDTTMTFANRANADIYLQGAEEIKYKFNLDKFWIKKGRNEYLRKVYTRNKSYGYPSRAINSMIWSNPVKQATGNDLYMNEVLSSWIKLVSRGCDVHIIKQLIIFQLSKISGTTRENVLKWLGTERAYGGARCLLFEYSKVKFGVVTHELEEKSSIMMPTHSVMVSYVSKFTINQRPVVKAIAIDLNQNIRRREKLVEVKEDIFLGKTSSNNNIPKACRFDCDRTLVKYLVQHGSDDEVENIIAKESLITYKWLKTHAAKYFVLQWLQGISFTKPSGLLNESFMYHEIDVYCEKKAWIYLNHTARLNRRSLVEAQLVYEDEYIVQLQKFSSGITYGL